MAGESNENRRRTAASDGAGAGALGVSNEKFANETSSRLFLFEREAEVGGLRGGASGRGRRGRRRRRTTAAARRRRGAASRAASALRDAHDVGMGRIERARFLEIHLRRGDVAGGEALRRSVARELLDERCGLELLARFVAEDAGVVVEQIVAENRRGELHDALEVARGHGLARLLHRGAPSRPAGSSVSTSIGSDGIARLLQQLLGRIEHRIHLQDQRATGRDFIGPPLVVERERLLKRRDDALFHRGRQRGVAWITHACARISDGRRDYSDTAAILQQGLQIDGLHCHPRCAEGDRPLLAGREGATASSTPPDRSRSIPPPASSSRAPSRSRSIASSRTSRRCCARPAAASTAC